MEQKKTQPQQQEVSFTYYLPIKLRRDAVCDEKPVEVAHIVGNYLNGAACRIHCHVTALAGSTCKYIFLQPRSSD